MLEKMKSLKVNAALNMIKQGCSVLFPLITFSYVSRVLGSEGFGAYNFSFSVADYFINFAALGIGAYAVREGAKQRDRKELTEEFCREVFTINFISALLSTIALAILLISVRSLASYRTLIIIISSQLWLFALGAEWINEIYEDYLYMTVRYIVIQVISLVLTFTLVKTREDVAGYALILVFTSAGGNILNIWHVRKYAKLRLVFTKEVLRHLKPIFLLYATNLAVSIYVNADITMLKFYRSDAMIGVYSLSTRIYAIAKRLVVSSITAMTARLAFYSRNDRPSYLKVTKQALNMLVFLFIPCVAGMMMMSKPIILLVGGAEYLGGWLSLDILSVAMVFALLSGFFSSCVLVIFNCERILLISTSIAALVNIILNLFMLPAYGIEAAAVTTLVAEMINMVIQLRYARKYLDGTRLLSSENLVKCLISTVSILIICFAVRQLAGDGIKSLFIAVPLSCISYAGLNLLLHNSMFYSFLKLGEKKRHTEKETEK